MRVLVKKTSESSFKEIREYENLEECVDTLFENECFGSFTPEIVISEADYLDCKYLVEIYDTWRE